MAEVEYSKRVQLADKWSWIVSTFVAMAFFGLAIWVTLNVQFSAVVAAGVGIGMQYLIPYYASMTTPPEERVAIEEHPTADNFHHGSAACALIVGSISAFGGKLATQNPTSGLVVGLLVFPLMYILFSRILPKR